MKLRHPRLTRLAARCLVTVFRLLFRTLRVQFHEADPATNPYSGTGPAVVFSVWHDAMIYSIFAGRHARTVALVSKHEDGSLLAECLARLGIDLVRGSSSRQGVEALREMMRVPADRNIVLTPDGPRGPEHRTKPGMTLLASRTGRPIVASGFAAARTWKISGRWTTLEIPRPFTKVFFLTGAPMRIRRGASREELSEYETQVQDEMDRLTDEAQRLASIG